MPNNNRYYLDKQGLAYLVSKIKESDASLALRITELFRKIEEIDPRVYDDEGNLIKVSWDYDALFNGTVSGEDPVEDNDLVTKAYLSVQLDELIKKLQNGGFGGGSGDSKVYYNFDTDIMKPMTGYECDEYIYSESLDEERCMCYTSAGLNGIVIPIVSDQCGYYPDPNSISVYTLDSFIHGGIGSGGNSGGSIDLANLMDMVEIGSSGSSGSSGGYGQNTGTVGKDYVEFYVNTFVTCDDYEIPVIIIPSVSQDIVVECHDQVNRYSINYIAKNQLPYFYVEDQCDTGGNYVSFYRRYDYGPSVYFQYSYDTETWYDYNVQNNSTYNNGNYIYFNGNDRIYFRSGYDYIQELNWSYGQDPSCYLRFYANCDVSLGGNISTLLQRNGFVSYVPDYAFACMFYECYHLTYAFDLVMPKYVSDRCYMYMFSICTKLERGPRILPCEYLDDYCYMGMFAGCTNLAMSPILPALSFKNRHGHNVEGAYNYMFRGCEGMSLLFYGSTDELEYAYNNTVDWLIDVGYDGGTVYYNQEAPFNTYETCGGENNGGGNVNPTEESVDTCLFPPDWEKEPTSVGYMIEQSYAGGYEVGMNSDYNFTMNDNESMHLTIDGPTYCWHGETVQFVMKPDTGYYLDFGKLVIVENGKLRYGLNANKWNNNYKVNSLAQLNEVETAKSGIESTQLEYPKGNHMDNGVYSYEINSTDIAITIENVQGDLVIYADAVSMNCGDTYTVKVINKDREYQWRIMQNGLYNDTENSYTFQYSPDIVDNGGGWLYIPMGFEGPFEVNNNTVEITSDYVDNSPVVDPLSFTVENGKDKPNLTGEMGNDYNHDTRVDNEVFSYINIENPRGNLTVRFNIRPMQSCVVFVTDNLVKDDPRNETITPDDTELNYPLRHNRIVSRGTCMEATFGTEFRVLPDSGYVIKQVLYNDIIHCPVITDNIYITEPWSLNPIVTPYCAPLEANEHTVTFNQEINGANVNLFYGNTVALDESDYLCDIQTLIYRDANYGQIMWLNSGNITVTMGGTTLAYGTGYALTGCEDVNYVFIYDGYYMTKRYTLAIYKVTGDITITTGNMVILPPEN